MIDVCHYCFSFSNPKNMSRNRKNIWPALISSAALLGIGGTAGFFLRPLILPVAVTPDGADTANVDPTEGDDQHGSSSVVEILHEPEFGQV
jgi:hypothetical protein